MNYEKIRDDAQRRKTELLERQQQIREDRQKQNAEDEEIKRELVGLEQILEGVDFVSSDAPPDFEPPGFTDRIRKILTETSVPLVPTQIRDALQERGISGSSPKNLLINVHKVLDRIEPELNQTTTRDGKTAYRHKTAIRPSTNNVAVVDLMMALKESIEKTKAVTKEAEKEKG